MRILRLEEDFRRVLQSAQTQEKQYRMTLAVCGAVDAGFAASACWQPAMKIVPMANTMPTTFRSMGRARETCNSDLGETSRDLARCGYGNSVWGAIKILAVQRNYQHNSSDSDKERCREKTAARQHGNDQC
jgi:hypothetical protein